MSIAFVLIFSVKMNNSVSTRLGRYQSKPAKQQPTFFSTLRKQIYLATSNKAVQEENGAVGGDNLY